MKTCRFCQENDDVRKVKVKGIKPFYACSSCLEIIDDYNNDKNQDYNQKITSRERDLDIPRDLVNVLYILPKNAIIKVNTRNGFQEYVSNCLNDYPNSHLISSIIYESFIFFFLSFGIYLFEPLKIPFTAVSAVAYYSSIILISFLSGVLILDTPATNRPCKNAWKIMSSFTNLFKHYFVLVYKIKTSNDVANFFIYLFI